MELCYDCQNIKLGKFLRQAQKSDEDLLKEHNRRQFLSTSHDEQLRSSSNLQETSGLLRKYLILSNLGSRLRGSQSVHCDFCALLRNYRLDAGDCSNEDDLVAIRYFEVPSGSQRWGCRGTPSDLIIMAVKDSESKRFGYSFTAFDIVQDKSVKGLLTCKLSGCVSEMSQAVPVNQPTINADELSRAIRDCHQNHQECSKKTTKMPSQPIELNLIDCRTRRLVARMSSETYVALSYVWGGVPKTSLNSEYLPRTLEDAIEVTLSLGFQYIWIDQFCVDQENHNIKQKQIQTMGRVYEDAVVTLVAASGSDANHGLPGAPSRPREFRPEIELDGLIISQKAAPIPYVVERSAWATRGWTFQEQFFSRRFLIFAPEEVSFECRRVKISSNWGTRSRDDNNVGTIIKPLPAWSKLFSTLHENNEWSGDETMTSRYDYFVERYWPRHLSVEEDGINAFAAVLETLKIYWNEQFPRESQSTYDNTIEWRMTFTAGMPHLLRHHAGSPEPSLDLFVYGMSWCSEVPSKRRKHFPSWCWAGWVPSEPTEGRAISSAWYDCKPMVHNVFFLQNTAAGTTSSEDQTITTKRIPIAEHELLSVPIAVIFDAPSVPLSGLSWTENAPGPRLWGYKVGWSNCAYTLDRHMFLQDVLRSECCLIVLASTLDDKWSLIGPTIFLLVRRVDQCRYERISLVFFLDNSAIGFEPLFRERLEEVRTWELV